MNQTLITISGTFNPTIREQIAAGKRPRADYLELAEAMDGDLLDYAAARKATGWLGTLIERIAGANVLLAWACFCARSRYSTIFTDGEQVGIPLAAMLKFLGGKHRPRHLMIVHILSVPKKRIFFDRLGIQSHIDLFMTYATAQQQFVTQQLHVPAERVVFTPFMVDDTFFHPAHVTPHPKRMICSAGLERRDYPTLIEAVRGLDVEVVIAAASPWSKQRDSTEGQALPANVTINRLNLFDLRQLYADAAFVVMPLHDVDFQAGITTILEAMAMGKAIVCTRTPGQTDIVREGETGLYVPVGDSRALRNAIQYLLDRPDEAARMGAAARRDIETWIGLDHYVERLSSYVYHHQLS